jgi:hypothetical protein
MGARGVFKDYLQGFGSVLNFWADAAQGTSFDNLFEHNDANAMISDWATVGADLNNSLCIAWGKLSENERRTIEKAHPELFAAINAIRTKARTPECRKLNRTAIGGWGWTIAPVAILPTTAVNNTINTSTAILSA